MIITIPKLIAHRGASALLPENTLAAFKLAKSMGAAMIECDVQLSRDNIPIIFHDDTLERTTHGHGIVAHYTCAELQTLGIKTKSLTQEALYIPTLLETLEWCLAHNMQINLELKVNHQAHSPQLVQEVLQVIRRLPKQLEDLMLVSSFNWPYLREFRRQAPQFALGILVSPQQWQQGGLSGISAISQELNPYTLNVAAELLTGLLGIRAKRIKVLKTLAPFLLVYTVNHQKYAQKLLSAGVDGLFSDYPDLLPLYPLKIRISNFVF